MNESLPIGTAAIINTVFKCGTFYDPCLYYRQTQTIGGVVLVSQYKQLTLTPLLTWLFSLSLQS